MNYNKILSVVTLLAFFGAAQALQGQVTPTDGNYVHVIKPQKEVTIANIATEGGASDPAAERHIQSILYYDGLGRPQQQIQIMASPSNGDIINHIGYDQYGRAEKEWLPYNDLPGNHGTFRVNAVFKTNEHYETVKYQNTTNPYSQKEFERSPLNRTMKQAAPGEDWKLLSVGDDHSIEFGYLTNTHDPFNTTDPTKDNVRIYDVSFVNDNPEEDPVLQESGYYAEAELYKTVTKDENHDGTGTKLHTTEEFTDKSGRVVLKRTYALVGANETAHDTYYTYDDYGNLTYVIPPLANTADGISNGELAELCYQYKYDHRNRLVEKKIPGKGWEHIVYNKLDQPIMTQDSVQRANNEWLFTKYDAFGRVAYTGKATSPAGTTRAEVQDQVDALSSPLWVEKQSTNRDSEFAETVDIFYNNGAYPNETTSNAKASLTEVLTINYYDNYDFDRANEPDPPTLVFDENLDSRTKGLGTGSRVKVLETNNWITAITRYDDMARPIYAYSENEYLGTIDIVETDLDFVGKPLKVRTAHTRANSTIATLDNFEYDHVGRLLSQTQCIGNENLGYDCNGTIVEPNLVLENTTVTADQIAPNSVTISPVTTISGDVTLGVNASLGGSGGPEELIVYNKYDELGQMDQKKVGGTPNTDFDTTTGLQTVDYTYNVRGWLKSINQDVNDDNDLFNFGINYNTAAHGGTPLFNGNISETEWETANDNTARWYHYGYDALNRITSATGSSSNYNLGLVQYDKNGNIERLTRNGHRDVNVTSFGLMDDLTYSYTGNQLQAVDDANPSSSVTGFVDGMELQTEYTYDGNGNMITDSNKGITGIGYNHLNLPTNIVINNSNHNGTIDYIYDATGSKLRKTAEGSITEYAGNYVYSGGGVNTALQFFAHPEGYVAPDGQGGYTYVYQYKDHLGNIRVSYAGNNGSAEMIEENNYYPFGLTHKGYNDGQFSSLGNDVAQKWKFGGKEYQDELDLAWYDVSARNYDPTLGRWMNIDPLAEIGHNYAPYIYAFNNPMLFVDEDGKWSIGFQSRGSNRRGRGPKTLNLGFKLNALNKSDYTTAEILTYSPIIGLFAELYQSVEGERTGNDNLKSTAAGNILISAAGGKVFKKLSEFANLDEVASESVSELAATLFGESSIVENQFNKGIDESVFIDEFVSSNFRLLGYTDENNNFKSSVIQNLISEIADEKKLDPNILDDLYKIRKSVKRKLNSLGFKFELSARNIYRNLVKKREASSSRRGSGDRARKRNRDRSPIIWSNTLNPDEN